HDRWIVSIGREIAMLAQRQRVGGMCLFHRGVRRVSARRRCFFVRDCDAVSLHRQRFERFHKRRKIPSWHPKRNVNSVDTELAKRGIMNQGTVTLNNRVADHAENPRLAIDSLNVIDLLNVVKSGHARGDAALFVKRGIRKWRAEFQAEETARYADITHTECDCRRWGISEQVKHSKIIRWRLRHDGD